MKRDLTTLLCCPDCRTPLMLQDATPRLPEVETGGLVCGQCRRAHPIVRGVPRFVSATRYAGGAPNWKHSHRGDADLGHGYVDAAATLAERTGFRPEELRHKLVLDAGCGAGRFLDAASRWGATVVGVDPSSAVDAARQRLGGRPNVSVVQADPARLPFRDSIFDVIYSVGALQYADDAREAFLQLPRALKTDGELAVWLPEGQDRILRAAHRFWSWLFATCRGWRRRAPGGTDTAFPPARVLGWCREGAIRDVQVLATPTSIRGRRDVAGRRPEVRWSVPDVRYSRVLAFGADAAGQRSAAFLRRVAPGAVVGVVDNDPAVLGMRTGDVTVQRFEDVPRHAYDVVVVASRPDEHAIAAQLRAAGLVDGVHFVGAEQVARWHGLVVACEEQAA